jgi:hypothetical protein
MPTATATRPATRRGYYSPKRPVMHPPSAEACLKQAGGDPWLALWLAIQWQRRYERGS